MHARAVGEQDTGNTGAEHNDDEGEQYEGDVSLLFKEAHFGELGEEGTVVAGDIGDGVVFEVVAGEEVVEVAVGGVGVKGEECIGDVLAGEVEEWLLAAGMVEGPL